MNDRTIEMSWACAACARENLGRFLVCEACGNPKSDEPWIMPADVEAAPDVTDPALLELADRGPNWRCRHCDSEARKASGECAHCGASEAAGEVAPDDGARQPESRAEDSEAGRRKVAAASAAPHRPSPGAR